MYKYIFIDLDDTIWDFHSNAKLSLADIFSERKLDRYFDNFEEFFAIYAKKNIELWDLYGKGIITKDFLMAERFRFPLAQMGVNDQKLAEAIGIQYLDILPTKKALMPHAIEILDYLHGKYPLTIISNGFVEVQYKKINSSNIAHYFKHIVLSEEANALKPDKRIFEHAMKLNGANANECIMIGDSYEADIVGAQNAGIDQVFYPLKKEDTNKEATYTIQSLLELKNII